MKSLIKIGKETGVEVTVIRNIIARDKIRPSKKVSIRRHFFDKDQESKIHKVLYFEARFDTLIFESKINYEG